MAICPCCKELVSYGNPDSNVLEDHYGLVRLLLNITGLPWPYLLTFSNRTCMKERQKRQYLENRGKAKKNDPHAPVSMVSIICDICGKKVLLLRLQISFF